MRSSSAASPRRPSGVRLQVGGGQEVAGGVVGREGLDRAPDVGVAPVLVDLEEDVLDALARMSGAAAAAAVEPARGLALEGGGRVGIGRRDPRRARGRPASRALPRSGCRSSRTERSWRRRRRCPRSAGSASSAASDSSKLGLVAVRFAPPTRPAPRASRPSPSARSRSRGSSHAGSSSSNASIWVSPMSSTPRPVWRNSDEMPVSS